MRRERKREGPTRVYKREEESVSMCVRRCVRNFEEEEKITCKTLSKNRHLPILHTAHAYKEYIHTYTYTHPRIRIHLHTHTCTEGKKKEGKKCACAIAEKDARSLLLLYYYRVTPYVCLYYRGVHLNRWSF